MAVALVEHPTSNTDAQNFCAGLDWLEYTVPDGVPAANAVPFLASDSWTHVPSGGNGYSRSLVYGSIRILYGGQAGMGAHVVMSSKALGEVVEECGVASGGELLDIVAVVGGRVSRLDLAFDLVNGDITVERLHAAAESGDCVTRFRTFRLVEDRLCTTGESRGKTLYLGTGKGDSLIRAYDKKSERLSKGDASEKVSAAALSAWLRVEYQFRHAAAERIATLLRLGGMRAVEPVLIGLWSPVVARKRNNIQKSVVVGWWAEFIGTSVRAKLGLPKLRPSLERAAAWVERCVAPMLAAVVRASGMRLGYWRGTLQRGERRWTEKHRLVARQPWPGVELTWASFKLGIAG